MKIAWVFPHTERCGIAIYAQGYVAALGKEAEIKCFDPSALVADCSSAAVSLNNCDIVHFQYEALFFFEKGRDHFPEMCRAIHVPIIVSVHEIYRSFPDVYPRERIRGHGPLAIVKRCLYDRRHPLQTAYYRHALHSFYAQRVLVHHEFQREILLDQGCSSQALTLFPHPAVLDTEATYPQALQPGAPLHLAGSGFINPHFDYELLFAALERLTIPWTFTWIGGVRRQEDIPLQNEIVAHIESRGWTDRFRITGWVSECDLRSLLRKADIVCAFFIARSSSGSLAAAFKCLRPVIATPIPMTEAFARDGMLHLSPADPDRVAKEILTLARQEDLRSSIVAKEKEYCLANGYASLSRRLMDIYRGVHHANERYAR
jgi:glycosyltransferase involved in cell wall biosynthesis